MPRTGSVIAGRYRVDGSIARGGMGKVFRATHIALDRTVAVKVLDPSPDALDPAAPRRFEMEARVLAACNHPNVVTVHDYGRDENGLSYLVMDLLDGPTLAQLIDDEGPLSPTEIARIGIGVAGALAKLHALGFVHRDIKANNVIWAAENRRRVPKLIDFGLVKARGDASAFSKREGFQALTQPGILLGSPLAMSPEQVAGTRLDVESDVYALGVLLHQLATGRPPFEGDRLDVMRAHLSTRPVRPRCEQTIAAIIERCLAKDPGARFRSMAALIVSLEAAESSRMRSISLAREARHIGLDEPLAAQLERSTRTLRIAVSATPERQSSAKSTAQ
jgi:eukaryotic-like serine/threonine-protein kinase